ncbi:MAG: hypothetical protein RLZZ28_821 [Bacteroidota bacterium]|jgi:iron complex outermembrane receptor protein
MKNVFTRRFYYLNTIFLLLCTAAIAGSSDKMEEAVAVNLTGRITDAKTGKPLAGASIYIHEAKTGTVSDESGNFKTPAIPSGKYLVEVSYQGFATILEKLDIQVNTVKNYTLKETYVENEAVTVTGVASASKVRQSAQPVSIVKRSQLVQTGSTNIIDALSKLVPGVAGLSTGPAVSKPVIRGLGYNRVVTVNDGVRQEGQQWGDEHGIEIDEYSVQKVEVLKGPASLFYGSDAMAGVVHLITNAPVEQGAIKGNLLFSYNGNSGLYGGSGNIAGHLKNGFNWNFYATGKSAGDYQNSLDGKVLNSRFRENNYGGYFGINRSWGFSHILVSNFNQQIGMVEGIRDSATGKFLIYPETIHSHIATVKELESRDMITPYQGINHFKIASDNNVSIGKDRLAINIGYQQNRRREFGDPGATAVPGLYFDLQTMSYNFQYHLAENKNWKTSFGITGMYQQNRNKAAAVLIPEYNQFDIGGFVYTKKTVSDKLTISGGLRADHRNVKGRELIESGLIRFGAFDKNFGNISGSAGLSYSASEAVTLKLNLARGFRAPSVSELSSNGAHEGTNRYEYGDNNLKTETSFQADAGVEINTQHYHFSVNAFSNHIGNYIFYSKLASVHGGDSLIHLGSADLMAFQYRQAAANLIGFEAKLDIHPHPLDWLHFENGFSMVAGKFDQSFAGSNRLPFIPAPRFQSELRADIREMGKGFKHLYFKIEMDKVSTQNNIFTAYNTETPTAGYTLFNMATGVEVCSKAGPVFTVNLFVNNLGDIAYQQHLSRLKYTDTNRLTGLTGVFNMGRNFGLKINVPLDFKVKS